MKTHALTTKIMAKSPKNARSCERSAKLDAGDFHVALEQVKSEIQAKRPSQSWWRKLKQRF